MTKYDWLLFATLCGVVIISFIAIFFWITRKRYTRDKFAFTGFFAILGLASFYVSTLVMQQSLLSIVLSIISKPFDFQQLVPSNQLNPIEAVVVLVILGGLGKLYLAVYESWDGLKSTAHHEQEQNRTQNPILEDIKLTLSFDDKAKEKLKPFEQPKYNDQQLVKPETTAWHLRARQLWLLKNNRYEISEDDYDKGYKCWIGNKKDTDTLVLLMCPHEIPVDNQLNTIIDNARSIASHQNKQSFEIIIAHKQEQYDQSTTENISYVSENELLTNLVCFDDYIHDIKHKIEKQTLVDSKLTLTDTYVDANFKFSKDGPIEDGNIELYIYKWLNSPKSQHLAMLGEYGQGKSTTSLMFCYNQLKRLNNNPNERIPILIELRGKTLRTMPIDEILGTWAIKYNIDVTALLLLHMAGKLLLIFEGFDEIDLSGDTAGRVKHFESLWRFNHEQSKILITGRQNFFIGTEEERKSLGNEDETKVIFISPFNNEQIAHGLRAVEPETKAQILTLAKKDQVFNEVAARPSLLFMIANIWQSHQLSQRENISSATTIDLFIKNSLQRQQTKHDERAFMLLNHAERHYFMLGIAAYMAKHQLPNQISLSQLNEAIVQLIDAIPDDVSTSIASTTTQNCLPLKSHKRFDWHDKKSEVIESIKTDVRSCGLLVTDTSKTNTFKFAHKSYMELLQAQVLFFKLSAPSDLEQIIGNSITNSLRISIFDIQDSDEAITFFTELYLELELSQSGKALNSYKKLRNILISGDSLSQMTRIKQLRILAIEYCSVFSALLLKMSSLRLSKSRKPIRREIRLLGLAINFLIWSPYTLLLVHQTHQVHFVDTIMISLLPPLMISGGFISYSRNEPVYLVACIFGSLAIFIATTSYHLANAPLIFKLVGLFLLIPLSAIVAYATAETGTSRSKMSKANKTIYQLLAKSARYRILRSRVLSREWGKLIAMEIQNEQDTNSLKNNNLDNG